MVKQSKNISSTTLTGKTGNQDRQNGVPFCQSEASDDPNGVPFCQSEASDDPNGVPF